MSDVKSFGMFRRSDSHLVARGVAKSPEEFCQNVRPTGYNKQEYYVAEVDPLPFGDSPYMPRDGPSKKGCYDALRYHLPFKKEDVAQVYKGKPGCRCGCLGKYWEPKDLKFNLMYEKVMSIFRERIEFGIEVIKEYIYNVEFNGKWYTIYLNDSFKKS